MMERADAPPDAGKDWLVLGLLLLLVLPIRGWLLCNTEVTARDSVGYIRYALTFERLPWHEVLRGNDQHPGYSAAVWAVSLPVRAVTGRTDANTMQLSAQLASAFAALLLLYPMYHLGRLFFGRAVGFGGALLFQYLPVSGQHLSDGISETLFLLLVVSGLYQGVRAMQERSPARFALCGLFGGLAYLTRPEGALVVSAAGLALLGVQCISAWRMPWRRFLACGVALACVALLVGSVYVYATGRITGKPAAVGILERVKNLLLSQDGNEGGPQARSGNDFPALFAVSFRSSDRVTERLGRSAFALVMELNHGLHYLGTIPALLGFAWSIGRVRRLPGYWVLVVYSATHTTILVALAMTVLYVSERHTMVLVLLGSYLVVVGLFELPRRLLVLLPPSPGPTLRRSPTFWGAVLLAGLLGFCVPKTAERLHGNRAGNRAVGEWLAGQVRAGDVVLDDHAWSHYYAGLVFEEGKNPELPAGSQPTCYVVMTRSRDQVIDYLRKQYEQVVREGQGRLVYHWPEEADPETARVVVYAQPRNYTTHPWRVAP